MQQYSLYICDKVIRIEEEQQGSFIRFCRGYIVREPAPEPDFVITVKESELYAQREQSGISWDAKLSGFVIVKKLEKLFLENDRILFFHGSVVATQYSAYMFTAPSGTGKTTHSRLWTKNVPNAYILNGDKPFVSTGDKITAWGSPWCGSEGYNRNEGVELKAICFLERGEKNRMTEISDNVAIPMLAQQTGDPDPLDYHTKIWMIEALERLRGRVRFYRYEMNNFAEEEAFHTTYDVLSKL